MLFKKTKAEEDLLALHLDSGQAILGLFENVKVTLEDSNAGLLAVKAEDEAIIAHKTDRIATVDSAVAQQAKVIAKLSEFTV